MPGQVDLTTETAPFDDNDPKYTAMLNNLQGNILDSHGRHFSYHTFFTFSDIAKAKQAIVQLRQKGFILSAAEQAAQTQRFKMPGAAQEVFGTLLLSAHGLAALGLTIPASFGNAPKPPPPGPPVNVNFAQPMSAAAAALGDVPSAWEPPYQKVIDGLLIVAYGNTDANNTQKDFDQCTMYAQQARNILEQGATILTAEVGHAHLLKGEVREHFGFVDGISQPLFRQSDAGLAGAVPSDAYYPGDGLINLVVPDPFTTAPDAFASFFVFRKLEQNVAGWRQAVGATAAATHQSPALIGAFAVGRFQDGDPVVLNSAPIGPNPQPKIANAFNYSGDTNGLKCPFFAHTRKTNPRGDTDREFNHGLGTILPAERNVRIARRGVSYGDRAPDLSDAPVAGVGLLFMCYQANIPNQFAFMQQNWVNLPTFVRAVPVTGQDAVIGQGPRDNQLWPAVWGGPATVSLPDFGKFVTNKGGEFFLAPSIPTLEAL